MATEEPAAQSASMSAPWILTSTSEAELLPPEPDAEPTVTAEVLIVNLLPDAERELWWYVMPAAQVERRTGRMYLKREVYNKVLRKKEQVK